MESLLSGDDVKVLFFVSFITAVMNDTKNNTFTSSPDKRLSIMSDLEEFAFFGFPDFDEEQRLTYFAFTPEEWEVISQGSSIEAKVYSCLQMGYFKAKHIFF